jgi:hypothetical protein
MIRDMPDRHVARRRFAVLGAVATALILGSIGVANARTVIVNGRGCPILPATNVWNKPVNTLPVRSDSATLMATMGLTRYLHPDFGTNPAYGIPINVVTASTPRKTVTFEWPDESDGGKYPIPATPKIEGDGAGGDRHLLSIDTSACKLWELYAASKSASGNWSAGSGAIYDLKSNALRHDGWTSADAAGLPIYPGLVRYDEVAAGAINHAIRFTVPETRNTHIYPARHDASDLTAAKYSPMGLRLRLKAGVNISSYSAQSQVILKALKKYGMILADNGSAYYISGAPDPRWDDDGLHDLHGIKGSMFEAVNTTGFVNGP